MLTFLLPYLLVHTVGSMVSEWILGHITYSEHATLNQRHVQCSYIIEITVSARKLRDLHAQLNPQNGLHAHFLISLSAHCNGIGF